MTAPRRFLVGVIGGAALAVVVMLAVSGGEATPPATTVSTVATTQPPSAAEPAWIEDGGVRFATTVLVPTDLSAADGVVRLAYDLVPRGQAHFEAFDVLPAALPERWELRLDDGRVLEAETTPPLVDPSFSTNVAPDRRVAATVSFEADATTLAQIESVVVTRWRVAVPVALDFDVPAEPGQQAVMFDGSVVTLDTLLEQRTTTILGFSMERPADPWRTEVDTPFLDSYVFRGAGPGWVSSSSAIGGTSGGGSGGGSIGFQLTWGGSTAPDPIPVRFATTVWVGVDSTTVVPLGRP